MRIYLIRHGESYSNTSEFVIDDTKDLGLTKLGIKQVQDLKKQLDLKNFKIYSSPYKRAIESTHILSNQTVKTKEIELIEDFRELYKGFDVNIYKLYSWYEWNHFFDLHFEELSSYDWVYPQGESVNILKQRVLPKFNKLVLENSLLQRNICIVTHNWVIKVIMGELLNKEIGYKEVYIRNASKIEVEYQDGKYKIIF